VVMAMVAVMAVIAMIMVFVVVTMVILVATRAGVMVLTLARMVMGDLFRRVMFLMAFG
jgi:hypothetical protein